MALFLSLDTSTLFKERKFYDQHSDPQILDSYKVRSAKYQTEM